MNPSSAAVLDRLPHRPPFRFVTSMVELSPGVSGHAQWQVSGDEDFFRGHFPGEPLVPGVLIGEALAQLSGLVGLHTQGNSGGGRLVQIDVRFDHPVQPPATIDLFASMTRELGSLRQFDVSASFSGKRVARGSLTLAETPGAHG